MASERLIAGIDAGVHPEGIHRLAVPVAIALVAGIAVGACRPGQTAWVGIALILCGTRLVRNIRAGRSGLCSPILFIALLGYLSIQPWVIDVVPDHHVSRFVGDRTWRISGVIAERPNLAHGRWRFLLEADGLKSGGEHHPVSGRLLVSGRGDWLGAGRGDRVIFSGRLRRIRGFANPGGFDYERYMALQAVRVSAYARRNTLKVVAETSSDTWRGKLDVYRKRLGTMLDQALNDYPPQTVQLLHALLLGDRDQVSPQIRQAFNRAGVSHVLAISGLHIGMVATVSFVMVKWLLTWIPLMLRHAWTRKGAALAGFGAVLGYGLLAGLSPSTQRAMIMVSLFLVTYWVGRRYDWLNTLAVAALVILWLYPPALLSISFQLSFSAVLAILIGLSAIPGFSPDSESPWYGRLFRRLVSFVWVSLLAVGGTLPLVLYYFNQASIAGPVVNLFVVPLVGMVIVPAGLAGVAAAAINASLAAFLWHIAAITMDGVRMIVQWSAQLPWASVQTVTPTGLEICLYYLLAAVLVGWKRIPRPRTVLAVIVILGFLDAGYWIHQRFGRQDLRVTVIDVGQGTANLIQFPGGATALIDGGGFSDSTTFDVGARVVGPLLWRLKIATVDLVVLSHADSDHLNGLLYILEHFHVKEVWTNGEASSSQAFRQWRHLIGTLPVRHPDWQTLPTNEVCRGVRIRILAPPRDFRRRRTRESWRDLNNDSLVLQLKYRDVSFLFTGDIRAAAEKDLVSRLGAATLLSTVLIVPHHGSRHSSTTPFLRAIQPKEALISTGWHNRFGFPHADVIRRLQRVGARIWCTAGSGAIRVVTDGNDYHIKTCR
jgi:competence protein ComEC